MAFDGLGVITRPGAPERRIGTGSVRDAPAARTAALLRGRGLDVVAVELSELERPEGCVTRLSVRMR